MHNLIAIDVGSDTANDVYKRMSSEQDYHSFEHHSRLSIATNARVLTADTRVLLTLGTPLPYPEKIPESWQDAMTALCTHDGAFAFVFCDTDANKMVLVTDFLGYMPLYYQVKDNGVVISSMAKAFHGSCDPAGWGALISLGYTIGDSTLTDGVRRLPSGSTIAIDLMTGEMTSTKYRNLGDVAYSGGTLERVKTTLDESVDKTLGAALFREQAVMMSGGFDSRLIAFMLADRQVDFRPVVVSHRDEQLDADGTFAQAIIKKLGVECAFNVPDQDFFSSQAFLDYLFASEGEVASLYLFIAQVFQFIPARATTWEGVIPGYTLVDFSAGKDGRTSGFSRLLAEKANAYDGKLWTAAREVFTAEVAESFQDAFDDAWKKETDRYPDNGDGVNRYLLEHKSRNRTGINPFKVFQTRTQTVSPGMTWDYISASMSIPASQKVNHALYYRLLRRHYPKALDIPFISGNVIKPAESLNVNMKIFELRNSIENFLNLRPRLRRIFQSPKRNVDFLPSSFLQSSQLSVENDEALSPAFLARVRRGQVGSPEAMKLLFHWRVWRWIHNGELYSRLGETGNNSQ